MNESDDTTQDSRRWRTWWILGFALVFLIGILLLLLSCPCRTYELSKRAMCMANLNGIGKGIVLYQVEHDDRPPPNLAAIVADDLISAGMLVCHSTGTEKAATNQPSDIAAHCDYIYAPLPADTADMEKGKELVMVFELPANHYQRSVNVLFNTCYVKSILDMDRFVSLVQELNDYHAGLRRAKP